VDTTSIASEVPDIDSVSIRITIVTAVTGEEVVVSAFIKRCVAGGVVGGSKVHVAITLDDIIWCILWRFPCTVKSSS
jgi:hypothetical protein